MGQVIPLDRDADHDRRIAGRIEALCNALDSTGAEADMVDGEILGYRTCSHVVELVRTVDDGRGYAKQCRDCGADTGGRHAWRFLSPAELESATPWDAGPAIHRKQLEERQKQLWARLADLGRQFRALLDAYWEVAYPAYLETERWRRTRAKVAERCNGICELCSVEPLAEVHHKTYDRVGFEKLGDLEGLCGYCHDRRHAPPRKAKRTTRRKAKRGPVIDIESTPINRPALPAPTASPAVQMDLFGQPEKKP